MNLLALTYAQLADQFRQRYGKGAFHAAALYRSFYQTSNFDTARIKAFSASPALARRVNTELRIHLPGVMERIQEEGVTKLVMELADGLRIESVVIPMANHATVCISSQAGCRMGCRFCRTGKMGLLRNLTADEIVAQVYLVKVQLGFRVRNVVFMGMGEPLDNFGHVTQAIRVLEDQRGLDIARRHITLSTVGLPDGLQRLAALDWPQLKLAVSLNAPNDHLRSRLMPVNLRYSMDQLKRALQAYPLLGRGAALFIEYVLIKDVNDDPGLADELAAFLEGLPVKLNLIPFNPGAHSPFQAPGNDAVERFRRALVQRRLFVRLRSSKGARIRAACGQLGGAGD